MRSFSIFSVYQKFSMLAWMQHGNFSGRLEKESTKTPIPKNENKRRTSKIGAISKAQKAQNILLEKNLKFLKFFSFEKCRIVPKNVKGGPFWNYLHTFCVEI